MKRVVFIRNTGGIYMSVSKMRHVRQYKKGWNLFYTEVIS
jgi:hypothetical protein